MIKNGGNFRIWFFNQLSDGGVGRIKDAKYLKWVGTQYPGKVLHHCLGSKGGKSTDYCVIPLTNEEHLMAHKENICPKVYLPQSFIILNRYLSDKIGHSLDFNKDPLDPNNWIELIKEVVK